MRNILYFSLLVLTFACSSGTQNQASKEQAMQLKVDSFLTFYNREFQKLLYQAAEAQWKLNTYIVEGDTQTSQQAELAEQALAQFTGSEEVIAKASEFLREKNQLNELQIKQLEVIIYKAGSNPAVAGDLVAQKIKAETEQVKKLFGFDFKLDGKSVTTNEIDHLLKTERNLEKRLKAWESSKEVGKVLKPGLADLQRLRNATVQALQYPDYFSYQVSDYGFDSEKMMALCQQMITDIWPLYRELHTWARYTLAEQYKQPVPEMLPAHWLPNRWGQDWTGLVDVKGFDLEKNIQSKSAEWIAKEGEKFYQSMGFPALPSVFWEKSSLYPAPKDATYKKNNHASAWHMNNAEDVRSLMSIEPNAEWWETTLHELGHIYYYITYSNPNVPIILREGANRAFHEAMGTQIGLASMQKPFLEQYGLVSAGAQVDTNKLLLKEALNYVVLIPWGAGVMSFFEHDLYANNLSQEQFNARWWEYKKRFQGIVPPSPRGEEYCDAASKTHISDDAAQYYDYAISNVLLFQFHMHICKNILKQNPRSANYFGSVETGDFLRNLMKTGGSVAWEKVLQEQLGEGMSAKAMLEYFEPLMGYLKEQNKGRKHSLPDNPF